MKVLNYALWLLDPHVTVREIILAAFLIFNLATLFAVVHHA